MARAPQPANLRATRPISAAFWPFYPRLPGAYALENADTRGDSPWTCNTNSRQAATTCTTCVKRPAPSRVSAGSSSKPTPLPLLLTCTPAKCTSTAAPGRAISQGRLSPRPSTPYTAGDSAKKEPRGSFFIGAPPPPLCRARGRALRPEPGGLQAPRVAARLRRKSPQSAVSLHRPCHRPALAHA